MMFLACLSFYVTQYSSNQQQSKLKKEHWLQAAESEHFTKVTMAA